MVKVLAWVCFLALIALASTSEAQDSACLNELVPCLQYINSKKTPSSSCCDPLRSLITSDPGCLCSMLGSNTAKQSGVNTTQAQLLPARCGEKVSASMCSSIAKAKKKDTNSGSRMVAPDGLIVCLLSILMVSFVWASSSNI